MCCPCPAVCAESVLYHSILTLAAVLCCTDEPCAEAWAYHFTIKFFFDSFLVLFCSLLTSRGIPATVPLWYVHLCAIYKRTLFPLVECCTYQKLRHRVVPFVQPKQLPSACHSLPWHRLVNIRLPTWPLRPHRWRKLYPDRLSISSAPTKIVRSN